jgi:Mn-dependent DtxR family transcriptional regulator
MHLQESGEMYLETIYLLSKERGCVRSIDVAEHMGYSKPSVSRAMKILKDKELIVVDGHGHISLTEQGAHIANTMYERHKLLTQMLINLGVDEDTAAADACKIEHCISEETFDAIKAFVAKTNNKD